jgi:uncharacterized protein
MSFAGPEKHLDQQIALVTIQPTPFCNIDCSYCYLKNRNDRSTISAETIRRIFSEIAALNLSQTTLDISWHAGEPTVLPPDWYENAFALIHEALSGRLVPTHGFQTNATLLTDDWCRLFARSDVSVGVSIDGPRAIHDARRKTRSGAGTFDKAMAGIERLNAHGVPFYVISVLTAESLGQPRALFDFYDSIGVSMINLNFEEIEGINRVSSLSDARMIDAYKTFLAEFCSLMQSAGKDWSVREVSTIYGRLVGENAGIPINQQAIPGRLLAFDCKGNVSTFSPELLTAEHPLYGDFVLGNIHSATLESILTDEKALRIARDIAEGVELCRASCPYFDVCGGGAPSSKICENGSFASSETMHCRYRIKATTDVVLGMLRTAIMDASPQSVVP